MVIAFAKVAATRRMLDIFLLGYIPLMHLSDGWGEWCELLIPNRDLGETQTPSVLP